MEKVKTAFKWMFRDVFTASILIFIAAYFFWFWLALDENFPVGIFFLFLYVILAVIYAISKPRLWLKILFLIPAVFFWLLNLSYIAYGFPRFEKAAFYNRTVFIITHQRSVLEPERDWFQVRTWKWGLIPEMDNLNRAWENPRFIYDEQTKVMGIVQEFSGEDWLIYTNDGKQSRHYETRLEYQNRIYYLSRDCIDLTKRDYGYSCDTFEWNILQCELKNTSCISIMKYSGVDWDDDFVINDSTGEIDFGVWHFSNTAEDIYILVYSYGDHPRCYVDGCEIIPSP